MAEDSLSQVSFPINPDNTLITDSLGGQPAILSTEVAKHFCKRHSHILRDIDRLRSILPKSFDAPNFGRVDVLDAKGESRRAFLLTRDAFSLLVMGMTGKAAIMWKMRYIEAFNALEKAAFENREELAREAGYLQGRQEALCLPVMEAERKKSYLEGMKEGQKWRAARDGFVILKKIMAYSQKGLNYSEIGKLLDMSKNAVAHRVMRARKAGLFPKPEVPTQAGLQGVM